MHGLPRNWPTVLVDLAQTFGWSPRELSELTIAEVLWWHRAAVEANKPKRK